MEADFDTALRRKRIQDGMTVADELIRDADRDRAAALAALFDKEGGEFPPTYLLAVASLAAFAMSRSSDPKLLRAALIIMIDRQFADAGHIQAQEEAAGEEEASLGNIEPAGNA